MRIGRKPLCEVVESSFLLFQCVSSIFNFPKPSNIIELQNYSHICVSEIPCFILSIPMFPQSQTPRSWSDAAWCKGDGIIWSRIRHPQVFYRINQTSTIFMGHLQKSTIFMGHLQKSTIFMGYLQKSTIFMGYLQTSTIFMAYLHKITTSMGLYRSDWNHEFIWFYDLPFLWDWKHQFINMDLLRKINQYGNWWDMMSEGCISYFFGTSPKTPQLPRLIIMDPCELDFAAKQLEIPISDFLPQVSPGTS